MQYSNEKSAEVEKAVEWLIGPAIVFVIAALVCVALLSRSPGF